MRHVHTPDAPRPAGHYSQAIVHGGVEIMFSRNYNAD